MTLEKPSKDVKKTLVTFRDPEGRERSKTATLYHCTPEEAFERFTELVNGEAEGRAEIGGKKQPSVA